METQQLLQEITKHIEDLKGLDVVTIDLVDKGHYTDYMIICTGTSTAHVSGISDRIYLELKKQKIMPLGVEGQNTNNWVLMDYNDVIVHIFIEDIRESYKLEDLFNTPPTNREDA